MLSAARSLALNASSAPLLPEIPELRALYDKGTQFRRGEVEMIAGRSGNQKSGFALWLTAQWNLPTLYFSADMNAFQASVRLACMMSRKATDEIMEEIDFMGTSALAEVLEDLRISFSFGAITWPGVEVELEAYVEVWNAWPEVIVIDNLMDVEGSEADYAAQMESMQILNDLAYQTGATVLVLHHASDKSYAASTDPYSPPSRQDIKNGMGEKPALVLGVALDANTNEYRIATLKQRMGPQNPTGGRYATLRAIPEHTRFEALAPRRVGEEW